MADTAAPTAPNTPAAAQRGLQSLLGWMGSLGDETRLRLLTLLEQQELGVADLCDVLQLPQSTVSRHLKVLGDQGWVRSRRRGTTRLYRTILDELDAPARELWLVARRQTRGWATLKQDALRLRHRVEGRNDEARRFFSGRAGEWDRLREQTYGRAFELDALVALLPPDYAVADLGCGTGQTLAALAPHVARAVGVDNNAAMLAAARRRTQDLTGVELLEGELEALPLAAGEVDAACMVLALSYLPDPAAALAEAGRVVRPGGRLVVVDLMPHDRAEFRREMGQAHAGIDERELAGWLAAAGFGRATYTPRPPADAAEGGGGPALFLASAVRGSDAAGGDD